MLLSFKLELELAVGWFKENQTIVSPDRFYPAMILQNAIKVHPLSTYAKCSEKLMYLTPWYALVRSS